MRGILAFTASLLLLAAPAQAKFMTTDLLIEYLESGDCVKDSTARGYISGVYDSFEGSLYRQHENLSEGELARIVLDYVRSRPKISYYSAQYVIMRALEVHFQKLEGEYGAK